MDRDEFITTLMEGISKDMARRGFDTIVETRPVLKTNGYIDELFIRFDESMAPAIPVDPLYDDYLGGKPMEKIIKNESERMFQAYTNKPEMPELTIEEAREHIRLTLVNTEHNKKLLENTPHFDVCGELSAIPRWFISEHASFIVNNSITQQLSLTPDEVLQIGQSNIDFETIDMAQFLSELTGEQIDDSAHMVILSNHDRLQGASAILSEEALDRVHEMLGDYVILPSSIHEVICVPSGIMEPDALRAMVREVNETEVSREERLSDNIFSYDGKLSLVRDVQITPQMEYGMTMAM